MISKFSVFNDKRLDSRFEFILSSLSKNIGQSIPQMTGNTHQAKAFYRFLSNIKITPMPLLSEQIKNTISKCLSEDVVLAIQDTTEFDFSSHTKTQGLGYLEKKHQLGIKMHTAIAVSGNGLPLGILKAKLWERPLEDFGKKKLRKSKDIKDKESHRWLVFQTSINQEFNQELNQSSKLIHITDREGDIYDFFDVERTPNQFVLLRIVQDRIIEDETHRIKPYLNSLPAVGTTVIDMGRKGDEPVRNATLEMRFGKVNIKCPRYQRSESRSDSIELTVIKATEINTDNENKIEWFLATTLDIQTVSDVEQCLQYYSYRWLIERFFYVLKSGCKIEELQLETSDRIENAICTYSIIAMRILEMTYLSRKQPDLVANKVFTNSELQVLSFKFGKTVNIKQLSIKEAIILVARLGGFLARKSDGMPGAKTIWRGLITLEAMVQGLNLAKEMLIENQNYNSFLDDFTQ